MRKVNKHSPTSFPTTSRSGICFSISKTTSYQAQVQSLLAVLLLLRIRDEAWEDSIWVIGGFVLASNLFP